MPENYPAYYGILTANVRYNKRLSMSEKVMFTEITALSNAKGYCSARNKYFAELYEKSEKTISLWLKNLKDCGFIRIEYKRRGAEVISRKIYPTPEHELQKCNSTNNKNVSRTNYKNVKENITSINNTSINKNTTTTTTNAFTEYQKLVGMLSPTQMTTLSEFIQNLSDDVVKFAINNMLDATTTPNFSYLNRILMNYETLGITTVEKAEELEKQHQAVKKARPKKKGKARTNKPDEEWGGW